MSPCYIVLWSLQFTTLTNFEPCQPCRSRKKKCYHEHKPQKQGSGRTQKTSCDSLEGKEVGDREQSFSPGRVSEYNPQAVLADLSKPLEGEVTATKQSTATESEVASQVNQNGRSALSGNGTTQDQRGQRQILWYNKHKRRASTPRLSDSYRRYLEDEGAFLELPRSTSDALLPIYISVIDDLIPLVDGARVFRDYSNGQSSTYLVRAMCMVICKTKQTAPFLRLTNGGTILEPLDFSAKLFAGLEAAMKADLEPDRVTKIQILAIMHLHNDGAGGTDRSSAYLTQAISTAWSLSLHWHVPGIPDSEQCQYLWWSLRSLDKLNKPVMGAGPFLIDDTDVALRRPECTSDSYRSQIMAVSLALGDLMKRATKVYKASSIARTDDMVEFPSLAEEVDGASFNSFHRSHRGYLEVWYHVTAMLSCRYSGPGSKPYDRRLASADRILEIVGGDGHESLPPLPLVPYAISMATTMIYRALRDGQRDVKRASRDMELCCKALDALSWRWTTAGGVARLARRLWKILATSEKSQTTEEPKSSETTPNQSMPAASSGNPPSRQPGPISFSSSISPTQELHTSQTSQQQLPQWNVAAPYTQLDTAFYDMFDYGMPNVFRDPASWEFLHVANEDGSPKQGDPSGATPYVSTDIVWI